TLVPGWTGAPPSCAGQCPFQMSKVVRPRSIASMRPYTDVMNSPVSSSPNGACQPPRSNPPRRSSSGPPGPWYTPSRVTNSVAVSFMGVLPRPSVRSADIVLDGLDPRLAATDRQGLLSRGTLLGAALLPSTL